MNYLTSKEAAKKWDISPRSVQDYCSSGKISGAIRIGRYWFVPEDAQKPTDGRTKDGIQNQGLSPYHFPLFHYTRFYNSQSELTEDEYTLFQAQLMTIKGDVSKSLDICLTLTAESLSPSVRFGAYSTACKDYCILGLYSGITACIGSMKNFLSQNPLHSEDYKLILAYNIFSNYADASELKKIDSGKLSADALIAYECFTLSMMCFDHSVESENAIRFYNSHIKNLESLNIQPALLVSHGVLANLYNRIGKTDMAYQHIQKACRIGHDYGFLALLSKYHNLCPSEYHKCLMTYEPSFLKKMYEFHNLALRSWNIINKAARNISFEDSTTSDEREIMLLLCYDMSNAEIARLKDRTVQQVNSTIKRLCAQYKQKTKADLVKYCKIIMQPVDVDEKHPKLF